MKLTAICIFGIESVVAGELRELGIEVEKVSNGRIEFSGSTEEIAKCNLWLRTAERIYIKAAQFPAYTFDELFEKTSLVDWQAHIRPDGRINVRSSNINSRLFSKRDCQKIVKKAIADKLCKVHVMDRLPEDGPEYKVEIFIHNDIVEINLDTTGTGLHKRGYRTLNVEAPLKETIAAALLKISYWRPGRLLLDPFCGSGTFPIEAAMMSAGIAPGLKRGFLFEEWSDKNKDVLETVRKEARAGIELRNELLIYGSDISFKNVEIAKKHAVAAGVSDMVAFKVADARKIQPPGEYGVIICNPPYGMRISDKANINALYKELGKVFETFPGWSKYVLTDSFDFERLSGLRANKRRKIYNGNISCTYYQFFGPKPPK
jgi:putative N6-adenine-specific DNA methylase